MSARSGDELSWDNLGFGLRPGRWMYMAQGDAEGNFEEGRIVPWGDIRMSPASQARAFGVA